MKNLAEKIAERARRSISRFCYEECKSYCCRKGYLNLSPNNVDLVTQNKTEELIKKKVLSKINEANYSLFIGDDSACPSLKDYKCLIYNDSKRPLACKQFPLFIEGDTIRLSSRCLAVKQNLLYPYVARLLKMGYKLAKTHPYYDFDVDIKLDGKKKAVV